MASSEVLRVEGLTEFRKGLRTAGKNLPKALTRAHKTVANLVAETARPNLKTKGGKPARSRISASGTQSGAAVKVTGPTAFGDEFGGGNRPRTRQFRPFLGTTGYAVYPAIRKNRKVIEAVYFDEVIRELEKDAF